MSFFTQSYNKDQDFVTLPEADYSPGTISKHGGFFDAVGSSITERNQQIADSIPGGFDEGGEWKNTVSDEFITDAIDSVVPVAGSVKIAKAEAVPAIKELLSDGFDIRPGSWRRKVKEIEDQKPKLRAKGYSDYDIEQKTKSKLAELKQKEVNNLFAGNNLNEAERGGMASATPKHASQHGFTLHLTPSEFLGLSSKAPKNSKVGQLRKVAEETEGQKLGDLYLSMKWNGKDLRVVGHEGRHRAKYIKSRYGDDVTIPVHVGQLRESSKGFNISNEDLSNKMMRSYIYPQRGEVPGTDGTTGFFMTKKKVNDYGSARKGTEARDDQIQIRKLEKEISRTESLGLKADYGHSQLQKIKDKYAKPTN